MWDVLWKAVAAVVVEKVAEVIKEALESQLFLGCR